MLTLHCWVTEPTALQPHACKHHRVRQAVRQISQHFQVPPACWLFNQWPTSSARRAGESGITGAPSEVLDGGGGFSPEGPGVRTHWSLWNACLCGYFSLAMTMLLALTSAQRIGYSSLLLQPKQPRRDCSDQIRPFDARSRGRDRANTVVSVLHWERKQNPVTAPLNETSRGRRDLAGVGPGRIMRSTTGQQR